MAVLLMLKFTDFDDFGERLVMFDDGAIYIQHVDTSGTYYEHPSPSNLVLACLQHAHVGKLCAYRAPQHAAIAWRAR